MPGIAHRSLRTSYNPCLVVAGAAGGFHICGLDPEHVDDYLRAVVNGPTEGIFAAVVDFARNGQEHLKLVLTQKPVDVRVIRAAVNMHFTHRMCVEAVDAYDPMTNNYELMHLIKPSAYLLSVASLRARDLIFEGLRSGVDCVGPVRS